VKILVVDDTAAQMPALRALTSPGKSKKAATVKKLPAGAGQLVISCLSGKRASKAEAADECACGAVDLYDQPEQAAAIFDAAGVALLNRGCHAQGAKLVELALKIRRRFFGEAHPTTAASLNNYARVLRERGDYAVAEETAQTALQINRRVCSGACLPVAVSLYELSLVQLAQSRFDLALASATEGLDILNKLGLADSDPYTTRLMDAIGRAQAHLRQLADAENTFKILLERDRKQVGARHPKYATHLSNYASVKVAQQDFRQAESFYRQALDVYMNGLNRPCHPNLIDIYANLGALLRFRNANPKELAEAGELLQKALRLDQKIRGATHQLVANDHAKLGRWRYDSGDLKGALASFAQAVKIYDKNIGLKRLDSSHPYIAESLTWQGRLLVEGGKAAQAAQAEPLLERALVLWPARLGADSPGQAIAAAALGHALALQGKDPARARQLLQYAYPIILKFVGPQNPLTARVAQWLKDVGCQTP
jgi:hypothetical protein